MKSQFIVAAMLVGAALSTSAAAAKKYYFSVGCYPGYKLNRIGCDVGTSWKVCAAEFCNKRVEAGPGTAAQKALVANKPPKLLSELPDHARSK